MNPNPIRQKKASPKIWHCLDLKFDSQYKFVNKSTSVYSVNVILYRIGLFALLPEKIFLFKSEMYLVIHYVENRNIVYNIGVFLVTILESIIYDRILIFDLKPNLIRET